MTIVTELTTFTVLQGKEARAEEWMRLLKERRADCEETLDRERMHHECIFKSSRDGRMRLTWFEVRGAGDARVDTSGMEIDQMHVALWRECIDTAVPPETFEHVLSLVPTEVRAAIASREPNLQEIRTETPPLAWSFQEGGDHACANDDAKKRGRHDPGPEKYSAKSAEVADVRRSFAKRHDLPLSIEPVSRKHFAGLRRALDTVAREKRFLAFTEAPSEPDCRAFYSSIVANGWCQMVAVLDAAVVGWCDVLPTQGQARSHVGTLGIGLIPSARHLGTGVLLMKAAIDAAWASGLTRIELTVRADNQNAKALYERFGFRVEGISRRSFQVDGEYCDSYSMALLREAS